MSERLPAGKPNAKDAGEVKSITAKRKTATKGEALSNQDILECIEAAGWRLRYNVVSAEPEVNGEKLEDGEYSNIIAAMRVEGEEQSVDCLKCEKIVAHAITSVSVDKSRRYDPIEEYLQMCSQKFFAFIENRPRDEPTPLQILRRAIVARVQNEDLDAGIDWPYECLKYWLCGAIAKHRSGFQNWMLVLSGPQGVGKSLLARRLGRAPGREYFNAGFVDPTNKDHLLRRSNTFIWEVEELDGTMNRSDMAHLKAFLTQDDAKERVPYGKFSKKFRNICSFIGTVNTEAFLKDITGNRRYLCMEVLDMDRDCLLGLDMDLVWGEARFILDTELYSSDGHIEFPDALKAIQARVNEESRMKSALEVFLDARVKAESSGKVTLEEVRRLLSGNGFSDHTFQAAMQYLSSRGFEKKKIWKSGSTSWGFVGCSIQYLATP